MSRKAQNNVTLLGGPAKPGHRTSPMAATPSRVWRPGTQSGRLQRGRRVTLVAHWEFDVGTRNRL